MFKLFVITAAVLSANQSFAETVEIKVNGLVCAFCAQGIEKTLRAKPATEAVFVSLEHGLVAVSLKAEASITDAELKTALIDSGYAVTDITRSERSLEAIKQATQAQADE
jgi:copper chaperone CopZ